MVHYNYDFEIASLIIMTIILLHFWMVRQFPTRSGRVFLKLLFVCIGECIFNILSCMGIANAAFIPEIWNELFAFAFFALEGLCSYCIFSYMLTVCDLEKGSGRGIRVMGLIPFLFFEAMVIVNVWKPFFYYFDDGQYYQGEGAWFGYAYIVYYFLLNLLLILLYRKRIGKRMSVIILTYTATAVGAIVLQFEFRGQLLTSTANVIILLMLYLAMQGRNELVDVVTGVANEEAFSLQIKQMLQYREKKSVMTVHIRRFHHITSVIGFENGNQLLDDVGRFLVRQCGKFHVFQSAEDTFHIIADTEKERKRMEEEIKKRFLLGWQVQGNEVALDLALIVQHYPEDFSTIPEYKNMIEYLLERAKRETSQTIFETNASFLEKYRRRNSIELAMEQAIRQRSFEVYYQPIYSLKEKKITSLEALVRLRDGELGFISPEEFIPIAEKNGMILKIGEQVLEECCKFLSRHVLSNDSLGIRTVHVNVSAVQCFRQNLKETIIPVLEKFHVPPTMISLELTEGTAVRAPELLQRHMRELGKLGMSFALDDYGSGNANCSYLIRFPFQEIKIDKEIVWAYFENYSARVVLQNEINIMKELGLPLIIEGIENKEQSDEMERLGVDYIQGYYYGRPMPEEDCLRYIRSFL